MVGFVSGNPPKITEKFRFKNYIAQILREGLEIMRRKKGTHHDISKFRAKGRRGGFWSEGWWCDQSGKNRVCDVLLETTLINIDISTWSWHLATQAALGLSESMDLNKVFWKPSRGEVIHAGLYYPTGSRKAVGTWSENVGDEHFGYLPQKDLLNTCEWFAKEQTFLIP